MKGIKRVPAGSVEDRLKSFINWTVYLWKEVTISKSQQFTGRLQTTLNRSTKYRNLEERGKKTGREGHIWGREGGRGKI